jgi:hypothetical protein
MKERNEGKRGNGKWGGEERMDEKGRRDGEGREGKVSHGDMMFDNISSKSTEL